MGNPNTEMNKEPLLLPVHCWIEATSRCNLRCPFCGLTLCTAPKGDMSLELFNELEAVFSQAKYVNLYAAGEPFMNPHYFEMLRMVKAYDNVVSVITNGTLLNESTCVKIVEGGIDGLSISIDGASAETFNYIRRGAEFSKVTENVRRLTRIRKSMGSKKPHIAANFVLTQLNAHELPEVVRLAKDLNIDGVVVSQVLEIDLVKDEKLKAPKSFVKYITQAKKLASELKIGFELQASLTKKLDALKKICWKSWLPLKAMKGPQRKVCLSPWEAVLIRWNGDVHPCCSVSPVLGNINEQDFKAIWNGPVYADFRRRLLSDKPPEECRKCVAAPWSDPIPSRLDMKNIVFGQLGPGWWGEERTPQGTAFRWMREKASFFVQKRGQQELCLKIFTNKVHLTPVMPVDTFINGNMIQRIIVDKDTLQDVGISLEHVPDGLLEVAIKVKNTFTPCEGMPHSADKRVLSIALCSAKLV